MTLFDPEPLPRVTEVAPGAVHVRGWLDLTQQSWLADRWREWAAGPVPPRAAVVRGHPMSVRTVCLGWHWRPYAYSREASDVNGRVVLPMPEWLVRVGRMAVAETFAPGAHGHLGGEYSPDTALVNFYDDRARMGMHQDRDERADSPVVSLSVGDSATFRFGNTENRNRPWTDVRLDSGDLFVFGGPARFAFHGITRVHPGTAPVGCGIPEGRINITLRETGLDDQGAP